MVSRANGKASRDLGTFIFPERRRRRRRRNVIKERERERSFGPHSLEEKKIEEKREREEGTSARRVAKRMGEDANVSTNAAKSAREETERGSCQQHIIQNLDRSVQFNEHLLETDLNTKNATYCLSNYVLETLVLPAIHPDVISITRKKEFLVALNVCGERGDGV